MTILEVARVLCFLTAQGVTQAPMDGQMNVLVRRCTYHCHDRSIKRHQIYYDDPCPKLIYKHTRSLYRMRRT